MSGGSMEYLFLKSAAELLSDWSQTQEYFQRVRKMLESLDEGTPGRNLALLRLKRVENVLEAAEDAVAADRGLADVP